MPIEAFCPNGHRIVCPDETAGRAARCPKCTTVFRIPDPNAPPASPTDPPMDPPATPDAGAPNAVSDQPVEVAGGSKIQRKPSEDQIVFLCPNGHKLNGPVSLAGRLGQCPHCHTKFQIPPLDVIRAAEAAGEYGSQLSGLQSVQFDSGLQLGEGESRISEIGEAADVAQSQIDPDELALTFEAIRADEQRRLHEKAVAASEILKQSQPLPAAQSLPVSAVPRPATHPLADLVLKLWGEREHGGIIELHLAGGNVYLPDWFEKRLSMQTHGLFAAQSADGTVTMTVVPWETVERVVIRGVVGLPDGMFE